MSITIICNQTYTCTRMREQEDENDYDVKKKPIQQPYAVCHASYGPLIH